MSPFLIFLFLSVSSASASALHAGNNVVHSSANTTHLHFYLHDTLSGDNPTAIPVAIGPSRYKGAAPYGFGTIIVVDDVLTEGPNLTSNVVGRAQGFYSSSGMSGTELLLSVNILLTGGEFNGSTVTIFGRDSVLDSVRELPVIGGSGKFRMARGYSLFKTYYANITTGDVIVEVDLYVGSDSSGSSIELVPSSDDATTSQGDASSGIPSTSNASKRMQLDATVIFVMSYFLEKYLLGGI